MRFLPFAMPVGARANENAMDTAISHAYRHKTYKDITVKKAAVIIALGIVLIVVISATLQVKKRYFDGAFEGSLEVRINNVFTYFQYIRHKTYFSIYGDSAVLALADAVAGRSKSPAYVVSGTHAKSVPVLIYHGVIKKSDGSNILLKDFRDQMFVLKRAGWETVSLADFYAFSRGEKELPDKSFLLTFDDGRKDSFYPVDPLLKALGYRAVIFVITAHSLGYARDSSFYLSELELLHMVQSGRWDVEPHTHDGHDEYLISADGRSGHFYSNKLWLPEQNRVENEEEFSARVGRDFGQAKKSIRERLGVDVLAFAFPFGDFGQDSVNFQEAEKIVPPLAQSFFPIAFYQVWPAKGSRFNYPEKNFLVKRIGVDLELNAGDLLRIMETGREKNLPYADSFKELSGWTRTWGRLEEHDGSIAIGAAPNTTGSSVFLEGTYLWENYDFLAVLDLLKGQSISLLARYKDNENFATCVFSTDLVRVEERIHGKDRILAESREPLYLMELPKENLRFGIRISGDTVQCTVDSAIRVSASGLARELVHGGIGFKTWDPTLGNSEVRVRQVTVKPLAPA